MDMNLDKIPMKLKALRIENGLKMSELAEKVGVHEGTISRYEKDASSLDLETLEKILKVFNMETSYFFKILSEYTPNRK